jgi:Spy/CpxP family protein refolding chaperone
MALAAIMPLGVGGLASAQQGLQGPGFGEHRPPFERALGPQGRMGRWWNEPGMVEKLKLSDDQRKAMDQILLQHRETLIDLRGNVEKAELAMEPLMKADLPDENGVLAQIDKLAQARAELEKANARFLLAIRGKLTPDQWKQLQAIRASRQERGGWGQEGMGRGGNRPSRGFSQQAPPPAPGPQGSLEQGPAPEGLQGPVAGDVQ